MRSLTQAPPDNRIDEATQIASSYRPPFVGPLRTGTGLGFAVQPESGGIGVKLSRNAFRSALPDGSRPIGSKHLLAMMPDGARSLEGVVEADHVVEARKASIMHVGRRQGDSPQRWRSELPEQFAATTQAPHERGLLRIAAVAEDACSIERIRLEEVDGGESGWIIGDLPVGPHQPERMELLIGERRPAVTLVAAAPTYEDGQSALGVVTEIIRWGSLFSAATNRSIGASPESSRRW